jgi:hypothetical protein
MLMVVLVLLSLLLVLWLSLRVLIRWLLLQLRLLLLGHITRNTLISKSRRGPPRPARLVTTASWPHSLF